MTDKTSHWTAAILAAVAVLTVALRRPMSCRGRSKPAIPMQAQIDHGKATYAEKCSHCHGPNMMNAGTITPDLREFPDDKDALLHHREERARTTRCRPGATF